MAIDLNLQDLGDHIVGCLPGLTLDILEGNVNNRVLTLIPLILSSTIPDFLINSACQAKDIDNVTPGNAYLSEDSILTFKLLDNLDSNTAQKHDNIKFILLKDITVKNTVVIPQNTVLSATVTKAHGSRIFGQSGIIRLKLNNYKINNTYTIHFNNDLKFKGGRNYANVAASMIVPFSGLLFKGKEVNYPAGTVIEYKLDDNLDLGIKEADLLTICTQ